jgi:superoxide reductase
MKLMEEKTADYKTEKHVPFIKIIDKNKVEVSVGIEAKMPHPMTKEHYIMWIELICKDNCYKRKFLKPGDEPKATFVLADTSGLSAREYCNLHGLWKSK